MSPEHDGIVVRGVTSVINDAIHASVTVPVTVKPYPQNMVQLIEVAKQRYPHEDWSVKSRFEWNDVNRATTITREQIENFGKKNDTDNILKKLRGGEEKD